jgi:hypothetical protein
MIGFVLSSVGLLQGGLMQLSCPTYAQLTPALCSHVISAQAYGRGLPSAGTPEPPVVGRIES